MISKKKAQITMESLFLYGVAILVVLLAVAALSYFGILDLGRLLPEQCDLGSTGTFECEEWSVKSSTSATNANTVMLVIKNKGTKSVDIQEAIFNASDPGLASGCSVAESGGVLLSTTSLTILPGSSELLEIVCSDGAGAAVNVAESKRIKGEIILKHKFSGGQLNSETVGTLTATVS